MEGSWLSRGPLKIKGGLEAGWMNRSNIYLSNTNEVSDNIYQIMPSIGLHHDFTETSYWSLAYYGTFAFYQDYTDNNWDSTFVPFDFYLGGKTGPFVELSNDFWYSSDPYGSQDLYNLGIKTRRTQNTTFLGPGWTFSEKTKAQVYGRYIYLDYANDQDQWQNQREWQTGAIFYYKFWPKTSALFQYTYASRDYPDQPSSFSENQTRNDFYVGLTWDATSKLQGTAKLGYGFLDYDNQYNAAGQQYQAKNTWLAEIDVSWNLSPKLVLNGALWRALRQSTEGVDVNGLYPSNYFVDTFGLLGVNWTFLRNLTAFANAGYGRNEYNSLDGSPSRDDDIFRGQVGLRYSFLKYLYVQGYYFYDYRDSNYDYYSYTDNVFYAGIGGSF